MYRPCRNKTKINTFISLFPSFKHRPVVQWMDSNRRQHLFLLSFMLLRGGLDQSSTNFLSPIIHLATYQFIKLDAFPLMSSRVQNPKQNDLSPNNPCNFQRGLRLGLTIKFWIQFFFSLDFTTFNAGMIQSILATTGDSILNLYIKVNFYSWFSGASKF